MHGSEGFSGLGMRNLVSGMGFLNVYEGKCIGFFIILCCVSLAGLSSFYRSRVL